jgi:hypothetical protein
MLRLVQAELPQLPDSFYSTTWYDDFMPRSLRGAWALWLEFRKPDKGRSAEAVVTSPDFRNIITVRTVPLAVHGPLVEFDRRLYTATIATKKIDDENRERLYLDSAIEARDHVWYQAGTRADGKGRVQVEEWRLDFEDDPRTEAEGLVTVRHHRRVVTEAEGLSFVIETRFKAEPADEATRARVVSLVVPDKSPLTRLPSLAIGDRNNRENVIWVMGQDRLYLRPAQPNNPKPEDAMPPGLMERPTK